MSDLAIVSDQDLISRIGLVMDQIDALLKEIGPKIQLLGNLRAESIMIRDELTRRGSFTNPERHVEQKPIL